MSVTARVSVSVICFVCVHCDVRVGVCDRVCVGACVLYCVLVYAIVFVC